MNVLDDMQGEGVVLVEDIPVRLADEELCRFFRLIDQVTSVSVIRDEKSAERPRYCWIKVRNPVAALAELEELEIDGRRFRIRLMGYLYPDLQES